MNCNEKACQTKIAEYNTTITLPNITKAGYTFVCWIDENNEKYTEKYTMPAMNVTLTAKWIKNTNNDDGTKKYRLIITFSKANISKKELEDEFSGLVTDFEIKQEGEQYVVIISFDEEEEAVDFIDTIDSNGYIDSYVTFVDKSNASCINFTLFVLFTLIICLL